MYNVGVPGALLILSGAAVENPHISFSEKQEDLAPETSIEIKHVQLLQNKALIQYLTSRKITKELASRYCSEAYYKTTSLDKQYFAIAFENDRHGYELRNQYFKGSTSPKGITTIPGKNSFAVNCFEGFMDFLSALTWFKTESPACDTIILNGVGFIEKFIDLMPNYTRISLFLDNDQAGKNAVDRIQALRPDAVNRSQLLFENCKDFNKFITQ